jgi:tetratricopeptide (TPR) repeat protein
LAARFLRQHRPEAINVTGQRLEAQAYALAMQHGGDVNNPYTELTAAWPTIQAALPLLIAGDNARLQKLCATLHKFLDFTGHWDVLLTLHQQAENQALAANDHINAGWRAYQSGWVYSLLGEGGKVLTCAERCAHHWQQASSSVRERSIAIRLRAIGYQLQKDYQEAITAYQQALTLNRSLNPESQEVATGLNSLANVKKASEDLDGAEADYREALRIACKLGGNESIAIYKSNLAELSLARLDYPEAECLATGALALAQVIGRVELIASNHHSLAQALLNQQRASEALPHAREAVTIFTPLRHRDLAEAEATLTACEAARSHRNNQGATGRSSLQYPHYPGK